MFLLFHSSTSAPITATAGFEAPPLRAVQLFKKPDVATGQLVPNEEGLEVLRRQQEPFSIVAAVGPTRTGKSSILGRAFLRGSNENLFEIGSGVMSHTGGVWITSVPVLLKPSDGGPAVRAFIMDTEGFSGVGGLTSRTYEANLFGMVYLMSSVVIFNSMYPVDASMVERMNAYGKRTLDVIAELNDYDVANRRMMPQLVWTVQSFNLFNLANSHMTVEQLLSDLKNTSHPSSGGAGGGGGSTKTASATALLGGRAAEATSPFVLESLFRSVRLLPVRRPHTEDEVVANLARYPSVKLSASYLADADSLREAALQDILPAHRCKVQNSNVVPLFPKKCGTTPFTGAQLVDQIHIWLKYGHIIDPSETDEALNETQALKEFGEGHDNWFARECSKLTRLLQSKLKTGYAERGGARINESSLFAVGEATTKQVLAFVKHLPRKSMARGIETSTFWQFPAKVATYIESAAKQQTTQCTEEIFQARRSTETKQRTLANAPAQRASPPKQFANGSGPLKVVKRSDSVTFEMASKARLAKVRSRSKQLAGGDDVQLEKLGKAREECFVVFD